MGKGDKKTKRGKIWRGSFGNTRPHKIKKGSLDTAAVSRSASVKTEPSASKLKSPKGGTRVVRKVSRKTQETAHEVDLAVGVELMDSSTSTPPESKKVSSDTPPKEKKATKSPTVKKTKAEASQKKESKGSASD